MKLVVFIYSVLREYRTADFVKYFAMDLVPIGDCMKKKIKTQLKYSNNSVKLSHNYEYKFVVRFTPNIFYFNKTKLRTQN